MMAEVDDYKSQQLSFGMHKLMLLLPRAVPHGSGFNMPGRPWCTVLCCSEDRLVRTASGQDTGILHAALSVC